MTTDQTTSAAPGPLPPLPGDPPPAGADANLDLEVPASAAPEPVYTAVEDWLTEYFLPMFRRALGGEYRWCAQWWQHGEAISRLTALWHAWEVLRLQPGTGIAIWYREHLDHQLPILMGARGPFCQCSETAHRDPREAAATPAPEGWWDTGDYDGDDSPGTGIPAEAGTEDIAGAGYDNA
jgi:Domain of unknown function (DUF4913)